MVSFNPPFLARVIGVLNAQTMTTSSGCFDDYIYSERRDDVSVRDDNDDFEDDDKNAHNIKDEEKNKLNKQTNAPRTERKRKTSPVVPGNCYY